MERRIDERLGELEVRWEGQVQRLIDERLAQRLEAPRLDVPPRLDAPRLDVPRPVPRPDVLTSAHQQKGKKKGGNGGNGGKGRVVPAGPVAGPSRTGGGTGPNAIPLVPRTTHHPTRNQQRRRARMAAAEAEASRVRTDSERAQSARRALDSLPTPKPDEVVKQELLELWERERLEAAERVRRDASELENARHLDWMRNHYRFVHFGRARVQQVR